MNIDIEGLVASLDAFEVTEDTVIAVLTAKTPLSQEIMHVIHSHWNDDDRLKDIPLFIVDDNLSLNFHQLPAAP